MLGRVALDELLLLAVAVETGKGRKATGHGRAHLAFLLHPAPEHLQVGLLHAEQAEPSEPAPLREGPEVSGLAGPRGAAVSGQEPGDGGSLGLAWVVGSDDLDSGHGHAPFGNTGPLRAAYLRAPPR